MGGGLGGRSEARGEDSSIRIKSSAGCGVMGHGFLAYERRAGGARHDGASISPVPFDPPRGLVPGFVRGGGAFAHIIMLLSGVSGHPNNLSTDRRSGGSEHN